MDVLSVDAEVNAIVLAQTVTAEAELRFRAGPGGHAQLFDLRQTILGARLDGQEIDPAQIVRVAVDGSGEITRLALGVPVDPCTVHTLSLDYELSPPSVEGQTPPLVFRPNGLSWTFAFSDIYQGRFLERWLPVVAGGTDGAIVLALCNPHRARLRRPASAPAGVPVYYALGDVTSWAVGDEPVRLPGATVLGLGADAWCEL